MKVSSNNTQTNDKIVRSHLINKLKQVSVTSTLIEEFDVVRGKARADLVSILDGQIHAYEIKSDVDTLIRLPRQIKYYNQVFSTVTLVVGREHAIKAMYLIPDWWGVTIAQIDNGNMYLNEIREAKQNTHLDYNSVSDLLRKEELINLLNDHAPDGRYWNMSKVKLISELKNIIADEMLFTKLSNIIINRRQISEPTELHVAF